MKQPDTYTKFFRGNAELLRRAAEDIEAMCQESSNNPLSQQTI